MSEFEATATCLEEEKPTGNLVYCNTNGWLKHEIALNLNGEISRPNGANHMPTLLEKYSYYAMKHAEYHKRSVRYRDEGMNAIAATMQRYSATMYKLADTYRREYINARH